MKRRLLMLLILCLLGLVILIYCQTVPATRANIISSDYFELRRQFLAAVQKQNAKLQTFPISNRGPNGEELGLDIAWFGSEHPKEVFLHISGTHGVEGYAGSAIQTAILENEQITPPQDKAIVFIHAVNPWGMAYKRRFNENNVDLNRNFLLDNAAFKGAPESYRLIETFLNPSGPPCRIDSFYPAALINLIRHGYVTLKQAIAGGQYDYEKGIYFGGKELQQGLSILKDFFLKNLVSVEKLYVVEIHTGLGEWAKDVIFWPLPPQHEKTIRYANLLGETLATDDPSEGVGFKTPGDLQNEMPKLLPTTDVYWVLQEFGAYDPIRTLRALRDENRYHHSGGKDLNHWSKNMLLERFSPGASDWQTEVVRRGRVLFAEVNQVMTSAVTDTKVN